MPKFTVVTYQESRGTKIRNYEVEADSPEEAAGLWYEEAATYEVYEENDCEGEEFQYARVLAPEGA